MNGTGYDTFEDELDAIRLSLYEETKGMTPEEHTAYVHAQVQPVLQEFNIRASSLKPVIPRKRERIAV